MAISDSITCLITSFLVVLIPTTVSSLSFNFSKINPQNSAAYIITEGEGSYINNNGIQVTPDVQGNGQIEKAGRAKYVRPLHLWDNSSRELASFSTSFTFVIDSEGFGFYADGLTFFLAGNNSVINAGGSMGLPINETTLVATSPFVAVEFDTYWDSDWDPYGSDNYRMDDHVGISINNLSSVRSQKWLSNVSGGAECKAWITYDSGSKVLSVSFTGFQSDVAVHQDGLSYTIDLRDVLPEWVIFGFSAATRTLFQKNNVKSWAFNSSSLRVDEEKVMPPNPSQKTSRVGWIVGLSVTITFLFLAVLVCILWWKKHREEEPRRFSYVELAEATNDFVETEKLGEGVYNGVLTDSGTYVTVKRVSKTSNQEMEYESEVRFIRRLKHPNLVQLIGWCDENDELLLVYENMNNGSLDLHLFKEESLLTLDTRYKIAKGLASALLYLHGKSVLHGSIKLSTNVMLDSNFNAKLGDFGLAKLVDNENGSQTTMLAETFGYEAPKNVEPNKATKESDVFSFGLVALELACGRRSIDNKAVKEHINLVEWVWKLNKGGDRLEAVDRHLRLDSEVKKIEYLITVGLWCTRPYSENLPPMSQVIKVLNFEEPLPVFASQISVSTPSTALLDSSQRSV